ncbi:MAG: hypothetical protein ACSHW2_09585 [Parasphingopyxis sp.]
MAKHRLKTEGNVIQFPPSRSRGRLKQCKSAWAGGQRYLAARLTYDGVTPPDCVVNFPMLPAADPDPVSKINNCSIAIGFIFAALDPESRRRAVSYAREDCDRKADASLAQAYQMLRLTDLAGTARAKLTEIV